MTRPEHRELRAARRAREISQEALAKALQTDKSVISRFELYGVPLPRGLTPDDYKTALDGLAEAVPA